jgi:hypothetical protein
MWSSQLVLNVPLLGRRGSDPVCGVRSTTSAATVRWCFAATRFRSEQERLAVVRGVVSLDAGGTLVVG